MCPFRFLSLSTPRTRRRRAATGDTGFCHSIREPQLGIVALVAAAAALLFCPTPSFSQTDIQAHYAQGQVWVVWTEPAAWDDLPETFAIYGSDTPILGLADPGDLGTMDEIRSGSAVVGADGLIRLEDISTYQDPFRTRLKVQLRDPAGAPELDGEFGPSADRLLWRRIGPTPFRRELRIAFALGADAQIDVSIYSASGRRVRQVFEGHVGSGSYEVQWSGRNDAGTSVSAGAYFVRISGTGVAATDRVILLR